VSFPFAITIGTYDRILSLPYVYHGPVIDLPFLPFKLQFRGRPLHEWAILSLLVPLFWVVFDLILGVPAALGLASLQGLGYGMAHIGITWITGSYLAGLAYRKLINSDESFAYFAVTAFTEARRIAWARGPIDWWVAIGGSVAWFFVEWALSTAIHINELVLMAIAAALVRPVALRLVHAFEPPDRARKRTLARAHRRGATIAATGDHRALEAA
jgi:hypothetical protein